MSVDFHELLDSVTQIEPCQQRRYITGHSVVRSGPGHWHLFLDRPKVPKLLATGGAEEISIRLAGLLNRYVAQQVAEAAPAKDES